MSHDSDQPPQQTSSEPSALDYLRSKLSFGRQPAIDLPPLEGAKPRPESIVGIPGEARTKPRGLARGQAAWILSLPWRSLLALVVGLLAQSRMEPPGRQSGLAIGLYVAAIGLLMWSALRREWQLPEHLPSSSGADPFVYRRRTFLVAMPLALLAFLAFTDNLFSGFNLALWLAALTLIIASLWLPDSGNPAFWRRLLDLVARRRWAIRFDRWTLLVLAAVGLVLFFRLYNLQQTPAEPFSDHAEKLLDVYEVSQGQPHIFFPRNTGREALQMYWTLAVSWVFGTGFSFLSLKLGTALIGLLTLPYMYLLGTEVGGRRLGLLVLVLSGIAYWPNVISRVGLRFPLYPMFVAPLMYYLIRGLRQRNRNDFILAGIFLGLGVHGYSPFRIVPLLALAAFGLYLVHAQSRGARRSVALWLSIVGIVSLIIFLPLLRYATQNPESFNERALTRLAGVEQPLAAPWYELLLSNTLNALTMFNWDNGSIWVHSIPDRPALDVITGALFLFGVVLLLAQYVRLRHWQDLFLLISIPILLLPSILSLAFPDENPSLNRTAGAMVPAFLIAALALEGLIRAFAQGGRRAWPGIALMLVLLWGSAGQNFDLVFRQYDKGFREGAWNSSEMGAVIKQFGLAYGQTDTAWVIPFPYWVDTRLVGVWAGIPNRDFAKWTEELPETLQYAGPKLFIARANTELPELNDQKAIDALRELYPEGSLSLHRSPLPGHDFWVYFVPALTAP
jgi:4-amino-4-deoxy-L-arabinose transferase-like glycosyltransferase